MDLISKLWTLGGFFYLSLILSIILYLLLKPPLKKIFFLFIFFIATLLTLNFFVKALTLKEGDLALFFTPAEEKINHDSFYLSRFAKLVKTKLPYNTSGCIYWFSDVPTVFLIQKLYPLNFRAIEESDSLKNCPYLISLFKKRDNLHNLILESDNIYLYKL